MRGRIYSNHPIIKNDKEFMVWDGEGAGEDDYGRQNYILLGCQSIDHEHTITNMSLSTAECLNFMCEMAEEYPDYIHVAFAFHYDITQCLKDLPPEDLEYLKSENKVNYKEWQITYIRNKIFTVKRKGKGNKTLRIADTFTFFQCSLIDAAKQYCPDHEDIDAVYTGKANRDNFTFADLITDIIPYWRIENRLALSILYALRRSLNGAGIHINSWHGPGAIADAVFTDKRLKTHIQQSRDDMPLEVTLATSYAFFAGHFEQWKCGHFNGPIYSYDIRSAYPAAMSKMPGLIKGNWERTNQVKQWGIYQYQNAPDCAWVTRDSVDAGIYAVKPFPFRDERQCVSFGSDGEGWLYGHELVIAEKHGYRPNIITGWVYNGNDVCPFDYTLEMYEKRRTYKANGNPAQLGLKLGMNSGYGKLAQLVGYDRVHKTPPKYHHPWYSGHITAWCRATILDAMLSGYPLANPIIACETDGIYSLDNLNVPIGPYLGQWELTIYDEMYSIQNGFYLLRKGECPPKCDHIRPDCAWVIKARGVKANQRFDLDMVRRSCELLIPIQAESYRYGALTNVGSKEYRTWYTRRSTIEWGGSGKRIHQKSFCRRCLGMGGQEWHDTVPRVPLRIGWSHPRDIPWLDADHDDPEVRFTLNF